MNIVQQFVKVQEEVAIARQIQESLVPDSIPSGEKFEVATYLEPSVAVGGDFYDYYELNKNHLGIIIGDVSGKGIPAAMHMAQMKGIFRTLCQFALDPEELLFRANEAIGECFDSQTFVTALYMVINKQNRSISYARAGHCPMLYYSAAAKRAGFIKDEGLGLGIIRNDSYINHIHLYSNKMHAGDVCILLTDGFEEGTDVKVFEQYGKARLADSLERAPKFSAKAILEFMLAEFAQYVKHNEKLDDLAMIVILGK